MAAITLKSLPANLHRTLKARAARHKRSLNQEVIAVLEEAVAPARRVDVEAMLAETRRFRDSLKFKTTPSEIDAFKREGRA
jgi:antitoxin FitA